jgi:hypothetical protein
MIKKCPRCSNENIKEGAKYCQICGLKLGTAQEVPVQEQHGFVPTDSSGTIYQKDEPSCKLT